MNLSEITNRTPREEIKDFFINMRKSSMIITLNGYIKQSKNGEGEVSDQQIIINIDYERVLRDSLVKLQTINSVVVDEQDYMTGNEEFDNAKTEIANSIEQSLSPEGNPRSAWMEDTFETVTKSVKLSKEDSTFYVDGVVLDKKVITPGVYKEVNSKLKTKIKNEIDKKLPRSKWRRFKLNEDNFENIAIAGEKIDGNGLYENTATQYLPI